MSDLWPIMALKPSLQSQKESFVKIAKTDESEGWNIKKFVQVQISSKSIKLQFDSGSDVSIINLHTWRKLSKPMMIKTNKIARNVTGGKIKSVGELITNKTFKEKKT